ncbi:GreA/GreB family elongation factor [Paraburkholderia sp. A1RI_3L]|uniref:GreA/GreB family elongation factor n=1 Tax=Paraburkholderia TaxID=1822464 RepID=UPI000AFAB2CC|nr:MULTISPECIES: GreA/GreB family elongation factor [Paraburkholderia]WEY39903.1 GreA/GreB family elongation factor [Paraburkholderia sp. SUR17]
MKKKKICYLTELEVARLTKFAAEPALAHQRQPLLDELLEHAAIVDAHEIARNVVTIGSQVVLLDEQTGESMTWTVVYPPQADVAHGRLNVFSPAGHALLGAKRGEHIHFTTPGGVQKAMKVDKILYQPEAANDTAS